MTLLFDGTYTISTRMKRRVTYLDGNCVRELLPGLLGLLEAAYDIAERSSAPEVLLLQSQLLTTVQVIVGVQDSGDGLGSLLVVDRLLVFTRVELLEIKLSTGRLAGPETKVVRGTRVVAGDRDIVCCGCHDLTVLPHRHLPAVVVGVLADTAVELDVDGDIMSGKLPWVEIKPVVGNLDLVAIDNLLLEDAVTVAQTVSPSRVIKGGQTVEETSGEATQASVSKSCIAFLLDDVLHAETEFRKTLCYRVSVAL